MTLVIVLGPDRKLTVIEDSAPASRLAQQINLGRWAPDFTGSGPPARGAGRPGESLFARQVGEFVVVSELLAPVSGPGVLDENGIRPATSIRLSSREFQVLVCLANGATFQQIAGQLQIKERTVRAYVARMKARLEAQNVAHLVGRAILMGVINKDTDLSPAILDK